MWVGWVTPDYHQYDLHFDLSKVRNVTVTVGDDRGNIHDRWVCFLKNVKACSKILSLLGLSAFCSIKRSNCYMVWGGEFGNSQQTRVSQEDFVIGCLVDLDTGLMTFTANGKEINTFYQVCGLLPWYGEVLMKSWSVAASSTFRWSRTQSFSQLSSFSLPTRM